MISAPTLEQIDSLNLDTSRPLIICDVDEVVVHFIKGFEAFLHRQNLWLDPASFALNGNIKQLSDNQPVSTEVVGKLLSDFFETETVDLLAIDGAAATLNALAEFSEIVFLSNLPHSAHTDRRKNLKKLGLAYPLISNEGPKGPAARKIACYQNNISIFIDDLPHYLTSVHEHCPQIHLVHFMQDKRFAKFVEPLKQKHLRTDNWFEIGGHIRKMLDLGST